MPGSQEPSAHHAAAAAHHRQAALFHRDASRHYQLGRDYAHAAHQALTAHGHALHAQEHGQAAGAAYASEEGDHVPNYLTRASGSTAVAALIVLTLPKHHDVAAGHHDAAWEHHVRAERNSEAEHYVRAQHATREALKHCGHALFHAGRAAMHHMEHYGSRPSAELS